MKVPPLASQSLSWTSWQISTIVGAYAPGMPGTFSSPPRVSDPDMHHGTCVTHVPWCMPGSLTNGFFWSQRRGKTFPASPAHAQPATVRIWQEDHWSFRLRLGHLRPFAIRRCHVKIYITLFWNVAGDQLPKFVVWHHQPFQVAMMRTCYVRQVQFAYSCCEFSTWWSR